LVITNVSPCVATQRTDNQTGLNAALMAAIGVANDDIEGFGVPDAFLYVLNFWHSVVSTRLLRDLASDQNDAYRMYLIFALG
jgi:hypothetical protein